MASRLYIQFATKKARLQFDKDCGLDPDRPFRQGIGTLNERSEHLLEEEGYSSRLGTTDDTKVIESLLVTQQPKEPEAAATRKQLQEGNVLNFWWM